MDGRSGLLTAATPSVWDAVRAALPGHPRELTSQEDSSSDRGLPNYTIVITSPGTARAWSLLRAGVPLSLLCDLADPDGPPSREILHREVVADDVACGRAHPAGRLIELPEVSIYSA